MCIEAGRRVVEPQSEPLAPTPTRTGFGKLREKALASPSVWHRPRSTTSPVAVSTMAASAHHSSRRGDHSVWNSASRTQALADHAAALLFCVAVAAGAITMTYWWLAGDKEHALIRSATVLIIACSHALWLAIPLVIRNLDIARRPEQPTCQRQACANAPVIWMRSFSTRLEHSRAARQPCPLSRLRPVYPRTICFRAPPSNVIPNIHSPKSLLPRRDGGAFHHCPPLSSRLCQASVHRPW